ncbi:putative DNA processing protein DprA [Pseudomonas avellanae]|uniref:Putative DNA processing protein DprA n=1 Tax=Pseudomonas avellanae TaxID=46257 RepID=A0A3M5T8Y6_9PSED|nr:putative DNA processing protein DprA [Pseudomonas avellanae]GGJ46017.1 hypothetical protein GCM10009085_44500 [Pseudomonas avellanae]
MPLFEKERSSPAELEARLRVHRLPEVGPKRFSRLMEAFGSASSALSAPASAWRALGLPGTCAEARRDPLVRDGASAALAWLERPGQHLLMWDDPCYPALLAQIADPPPLIFIAGDPSILERPQLGMVGSRRASRPGLDTAKAFARSLAGAGFVICTQPGRCRFCDHQWSGAGHRRRCASGRIGCRWAYNRRARHRA